MPEQITPPEKGRMSPVRLFFEKIRYIPQMRVHFSGLELFFWATFASPALLSVYLMDKGLNSEQIGNLQAFLAFLGIFAPPFWGMVSDKVRSVRKVFMLCLAVGTLVWATAPLLLGKISLTLMWVVFPISTLFFRPTNALLDSWLIRVVNSDRRLSYGTIRLFGSIGYAAASVIFTMLVGRFSLDVPFYGMVVIAIPALFFAFRIKEDNQSARSVSLKEMKFGRLLKNPLFILFLIFNVLLNVPITANFTFMPYLIQSIGENPAMFSAISGLKCIMEIPMYLISGMLLRKVKPTTIMIICACVYTVEMLIYPLCTNIPMIFAVQCVNGASMGIYIACQIQYVFSLAPKGLEATAQTLSGACMALAGIIGSLLGGYLIEEYGINYFYYFASGIVACAALLFIVSVVLRGRQRKNSQEIAA